MAFAAAGALLLAGCSTGTEPTEVGDGAEGSAPPATAQPAQPSESAAESNPADDAGLHERDVRAQTFGIDHEEAVAIAVAEAGGGFAYQIEVDWSDDHGEWVYEVEVLDGRSDHEFDLSTADGSVLKHERDDEDDSEREIDFSMTPAEALELAAAELVDGEWIEGWTLSWDDGRLEYDIDTENGPDDIVIDVASGSVTRD